MFAGHTRNDYRCRVPILHCSITLREPIFPSAHIGTPDHMYLARHKPRPALLRSSASYQ